MSIDGLIHGVDWQISLDSRVHRLKPLRRARVATADGGMKCLLDLLGHRAGFAAADHTVVDLAQANAFRSGATYEHFIGDIELIARDSLLDHAISQVARKGDDGI